MTEQPNDCVPVPEGTKALKVKLDIAPQIQAKDKEIAELNKKLGEQESLIKSMLVENKQRLIEEQKAIETIEPKKPQYGKAEEGYYTAPLETPEKRTTAIKLDEESEILSMNPSFPNTQAAIDYVKNAASNPQSGDYQLAQKMYGTMIKRALKEGGVYEFKGNMARYERKGDKIVKASRPQTFERITDED